VAFFFIDTWGRKPIQLMGFIVLSIIFIIMGERFRLSPNLIKSEFSFSDIKGFAYDTILNHSKGVLVLLYCLANFFQNFGPNTTTFIVSEPPSSRRLLIYPFLP
jgi:PHS family inorganic phosphate transporter-like MFS transporter